MDFGKLKLTAKQTERMNNNLKENQNAEFKESWRDEYLKWICGFANAQGGELYIGMKDDGSTCGIPDTDIKKLLEDIPNKTRDVLGIIPEVSLIQKENKNVLKIRVEPSSFPISYKGEYHYRTGSTKQQLIGNALTQFLLKKTGLSWDATEISKVDIGSLSNNSFDIFRKQSVRRKRMEADDVNISNNELLDKLNLLTEDGILTKAGYLLFADDPERRITGSFIKIGYFEDADILYQDEVHGSLLAQAEQAIDLIFTKYLKATITYDGTTRVETYPFPFIAVREAIYNSIVHRAYNCMNPTQIRVYYDKLVISNDAALPMDWTSQTLMEKHKSVKYSPLIASAFFKAGYIEAWGRGIEKICNACTENKNPLPEYKISGDDVTIVFFAVPGTGKDGLIHEMSLENEVTPPVTGSQKSSQKSSQKTTQKILNLITENSSITTQEIADSIGISRRAVAKQIAILQEKGIVRRIGADKGGHWEIVNNNKNEGGEL